MPRNYCKGVWPSSATGPVGPELTATCLNEDLDSDGVLGIGEDINGNGRLDPGIPMTITSSATTDASGPATVSLVYPRDRAYWLDVDLTIRGAVAGTEARYVGYICFGLSTDYTTHNISPPGATSPYGKSHSVHQRPTRTGRSADAKCFFSRADGGGKNHHRPHPCPQTGHALHRLRP